MSKEATVSDLQKHDLSDERFREYDWVDPATKERVSYRIDDPVWLYVHATATTHRVVDADGLVHCVPSVGQLGCVLRWKTRDPDNPVQF